MYCVIMKELFLFKGVLPVFESLILFLGLNLTDNALAKMDKYNKNLPWQICFLQDHNWMPLTDLKMHWNHNTIMSNNKKQHATTMMYIVFSSNAFSQCMHSLRIKRMTLVMLACCTSWTTLAGFEIYVVTYNSYYFKVVFSKKYVYIAFWKLCSTQWYSTWRLYYVSVSIFSPIKPLMVSSVSVSSAVTFFLLDTVHIRKIPLSNYAMDVKAHEWRSANASLSFVITDPQSLSVKSQRFPLWFALVSELRLHCKRIRRGFAEACVCLFGCPSGRNQISRRCRRWMI